MTTLGPGEARRRARVQETQARLRRRKRLRAATWLAGGLAAVVLVLGLGLLLAVEGGEPAAPERPPLAGPEEVGCSAIEELAYHVHVHLAIFVDGQAVPVPANVGIRADCIAWLHTHDASGVLHVEAPRPRTYTLGAFFSVWGQPLDATHLLDREVAAGSEIRAFVDGEPWAGAPQDIPLDPHAVIVLEVGPPFVPPPDFAFPPGL